MDDDAPAPRLARPKPKASTTAYPEELEPPDAETLAAWGELMEALRYLRGARAGHAILRLDHSAGKPLRHAVDVRREGS